MNSRWTILGFVAALVTAFVTAFVTGTALSPAGAQDAPTIDWRTDLAAARADAKESGRPLLVVFR